LFLFTWVSCMLWKQKPKDPRVRVAEKPIDSVFNYFWRKGGKNSGFVGYTWDAKP
jgi:hypothetical protein